MAVVQPIGYATAVPTSTAQSYQVGDFILNSAPSSGQPVGWFCTVAGYPGTFVAIMPPTGSVVTTTVAVATLANGNRLTLYNGVAATNTLPTALSHAAGWMTTIKNIAAVNYTLTPATGEAYADAAAITLTQFQSVTLLSNGTTNWYKMA